MKTWPTTLLPSQHSAFHTSVVSLTMSLSHLAPHAVESKCKCTKIIRLLQSLSSSFCYLLNHFTWSERGCSSGRWQTDEDDQVVVHIAQKDSIKGLCQMFKKNKYLYRFVIGFKSARTTCEGLCSIRQTRRELSPNPADSRSSAERLSTAQYWFFRARDFSVLARSHCSHQPHF